MVFVYDERGGDGRGMFFSFRSVARPLFLCVGMFCAARAWSGEAPFTPPFKHSDLDLAACTAFVDGTATPAKADEVSTVLGLRSGDWRDRWPGGEARDGKAHQFAYRVAFKRSIAIGSVWVDAGELRVLKPDAPYPGDPAKADHWTAVSAYPNQSRPRLVTLPVGVRTRALLCTEERSHGRSELRVLRVSARRLHNATPDAYAQAEAEYTRYSQLAPPYTFRSAHITTGRGSWQNTGRDSKERIPRAPVSDVDPSWFVLSWDEPRTLVGLFLVDNFQVFKLDRYRGPETMSPVAAIEGEWKRIASLAEPAGHRGRFVPLEPFRTRGIRLRILKVGGHEPQVARLDALHALVDLGDAPVPAFKSAEPAPPPFSVAYSLPDDRKFTLAIDDAKGRRVRNLVARADRRKGPNTEPWDLKDNGGQLVAPGTYRWKALAYPPLRLRYEMTPYPNVVDNHPENSPWLNGASGPGGWMADHTPPLCVCAVPGPKDGTPLKDPTGAQVFLGAPCAESGVSFIAADAEGRKLWGIHSFAAWSGPKHLTCDGSTVFVDNQGWSASGEEGMDRVWAVDLATHKVAPFLMISQTERRRRGIQGMVAADGKLFLSIDGGSGWLANAAGIGDVDIENCLPRYKRKKQSGLDWVPDLRNDFVRLFRLKGTPPGYQGLVYLDSTKGPSSRQHILLAFRRPVAIGSLAFPVPTLEGIRLRISLLKPDAPYPPDAEAAAQWVPFKDQGSQPWDVVAAPEGTKTRALRFTFSKGADDELSAVLEGDDRNGGLDLADGGGADTRRGAWFGRLDGMKLLRRRYRNLFASAAVRVSSGTVADDGSWDAERAEPLTEATPAIYALEWKEPQKIRGLAIMEIDAKRTEIDVFTGPDGAVDIRNDEHWTRVATYASRRRYFYAPDDNHNSKARYMDGYVPFPQEATTRAIRLRVVEQWISRPTDRAGLYGVRDDRGGLTLDPTRCHVYGVAPLQYLGGEPPVDPLISQRIEVHDITAKSVVAEVPIENPGPIARDSAGRLFALSGKAIVRVDLEGGKHQPVVTDLLEPTTFTFDRQNRLYAFDNARERKVVRVYAAGADASKPWACVNTIGTPGGTKVGPWDPTRFGSVSSLAIDRAGRLWAVERQYWPKRISQWTTDGKHLRDFLGNTSYGGGGVLDPWDKRRVFYGNLEFELDWAKGTTRLKNVTRPDGWDAGELPIRIQDRTYVVNRPNGPGAELPVGIVYLYEKDHLKLAAAVGLANYFRALRTPEILGRMGKRVLEDFQFMWSDLNGDGEPQYAELRLSPKRIRGVSRFNRDLGTQGGILRYQVKEFLPSGVPVYEEKEFPGLAEGTEGFLSHLYRLDDGNFFRMGALEACFRPDGQTVWSYRTEGAGGHALNRASPWHPAQVVCEFAPIGHETAHAGDLGEFIVFKTNVGSWNIWSSDGLLAGPIFRDIRDPRRRPWSMREHERRLALDDVTAGQEHFSGYFGRTFGDNRYYAVAGHNHVSVVEVLGIDQFQRLEGTLSVTPDAVRQAQEWQRTHARQLARRDVKVIDCAPAARPINIDANLDDWHGIAQAPLYSEDYATIHGIPHNTTFRMTFDKTTLYLAYETQNMGPFTNSGNQWDRLFKTGAAVDIQLGTDPKADPARARPAAGDLRLLIAPMAAAKGRAEPVAVVYRPVAPDAPEAESWEVVSPVWRFSFDSVKKLPDVRVAWSGGASRYVVEAAVPLASIGLRIEPGTRLKLDWGVLATDADGTVVLGRNYWANKATSILSDAPSEAALHPDLWGYVRFRAQSRDAAGIADPDDLLRSKRGSDDDLNDLRLEEE